MSSSDELSLIFKVSGGSQFTLSVPKKLSIKEMKEKVSEPSKIPSTQQRLIYKGRILKDDDRLEDLNAENGHTMHLVRSGGSSAVNAQSGISTAPQPQTTTPISNLNNSNISNINPSTTPQVSSNVDFASLAGTTGTNFGQNFSNSTIPGGDPFAAMMNNLLSGNGFGSNTSFPLGGGAANATGIPDFTSLMNSPVFQQSMNELANNPELVRNLLRSNPMFNQLTMNNPMLSQMLDNPEMLRMMLNPQLIQSIFQGNTTNANSGQPIPGTINSAQNQLTGLGQGGVPDISQLSSLLRDPAMSSILSGGTMNISSGRPPSELYSSQLTQLRDMGFIDTDANIAALQETGGDINAAINRLLERGVGQ
ncbi:ubiquitin family protein [Cryptosporidium andersoni]|uniref:Ubiquitin family protein n=1 Tax=Cryptosporidium andersoni TaxID=117008 RepID=A0A1J4MW42_9CRYT|nr:ubiquitin family protein [Cryptosporidium andersoni]